MKFPIIPLLILLYLIFISSFEIKNLKITKNPIELWVDEDSTLLKQKNIKENYFGKDFRINQIMFEEKDVDIEIDIVSRIFFSSI